MRPVFVQPTPLSHNNANNKTPQRRQGGFAVPSARPSVTGGPPSRNVLRTPRNNEQLFAQPRASLVPYSSANPRRVVDEPQIGGHPASNNANNASNPFGGRPSILAGLGRLSTAQGSMSGRGSLMAPLAGNHRPLPNIPKVVSTLDRSQVDQKRIIAKIVDYLNSYGEEVPFQYSEKSVKNPNTHDFVNLFHFLYRQIDPNFELGKPEEDVAPLMAALGCPYPIKSTFFKPLGASYSWPYLLAVLDWLVDLVEVKRDAMLNDYDEKQENPSWAYFITCYKERGREEEYALMLDAYRKMTAGESLDDEYDELKARRVHHDRNIKQLESKTLEENNELAKLNEEMEKYVTDIKALEDYLEEMRVQAARVDEIVEESEADIKRQVVQLAEANTRNEEKDRLIKSQAMSGDEARRLLVSRQNLRGQVNAAREALNAAEERLFKSQPDAFGLINELRAKYKSLLTHLRELAPHLFGRENTAQLNWPTVDQFDLASEEFINSAHSVLLGLIGKLKMGGEEAMEELLQGQHCIAFAAEEESRKAANMNSNRAQLELDYNLALEQLEREVGDVARRVKEANEELGVVQTKHKRIKDELQDQLRRVGEVRYKVAEAEKRYSREKNELTKLYNDIVVAILDKMDRLCKKFFVLIEQKKALKELGERLLAANLATLNELKRAKAEKRKDDDDTGIAPF